MLWQIFALIFHLILTNSLAVMCIMQKCGEKKYFDKIVCASEWYSSEWTFENYTYVSIEKRNIELVKKKSRHLQKNNTFFLAKEKWVNRINRVRHEEERRKKSSWIKYRKYEEHIIIFLRMDWFIAFVLFGCAVWPGPGVCTLIYVCMRFCPFIENISLKYPVCILSQFVISSLLLEFSLQNEHEKSGNNFWLQWWHRYEKN